MNISAVSNGAISDSQSFPYEVSRHGALLPWNALYVMDSVLLQDRHCVLP